MTKRVFARALPAFILLLTACTSHDPPVRRYHVRALVKEVAGSGEDLRVALAHERVPAFEDRDGKRSEMPAMTMVFGVTSDVPKLEAGQKLALDFDVRWNKAPALLIVHAEPLPSDTELTLESAR